MKESVTNATLAIRSVILVFIKLKVLGCYDFVYLTGSLGYVPPLSGALVGTISCSLQAVKTSELESAIRSV